MDITVKQAQARVPVAILGVRGDLDASNYQTLIAKAGELRAGGARGIVLDLTDTEFISSSGLVAIHSIALLLKGDKALDTQDGWAALHSVGTGLGSAAQNLKLLKPQPAVDNILDKVGFKSVFEVYRDLDTALAAF